MTTKTAAKHTPGPWTHGEPQDGAEVIYAPKDSALDGAWIATAHDMDDMMDGKANARLIAAAPELLAALKDAEALALQRGGRWDLADQIRINKIGAAIAKAEGREG